MVTKQQTEIRLQINGKTHQTAVNPAKKLAEYLRDDVGVKSVKIGCGEGGCGACAVLVDGHDGQRRSVNSCLCSVASVAGRHVITSEGLGNSSGGFHAIQQSIAEHHASQCGYCTPGMVVACAAAISRMSDTHMSDTHMSDTNTTTTTSTNTATTNTTTTSTTAAAMEAALDGNLCRCTGYRPILDACKDVVCDVEDLGIPRVCTTTTCTTPHTHTPSSEIPTTTYVHNTCTWHQPASMGELRTLVRGLYDAGITFRVVGGGTGAGVYKNWIDERDSVIVEVTRVAEMRTVQCDESGILLGASLTITNLIDQLETPTRGALPATPTTSTCTVYAHPPCPVADSTMPSANGPTMNPSTTTSSPYYNAMAAHLKRIAGHHVRNAATLGGHFALCVARRLESDVATVLGGAEASLVMVDVLQAGDNTCPVEVPVCDFLNHPPPGLGTTLMITHIHIPHHTPHAVFWSDRVAQRYYNSHSFVNMAVSVVMAGRDTGVGVGVHVHAQKHNEEGRDDTTTRTHTTNNYSADTSSACNSQHTRALVSQPSSKHIIDPPAQQQLGGVVQSITVQVGFVGALQTTHHDKDKPTTHPRGWLCQRVSALPTIMQHQPLTRTLLAHALVSVKRYLEDRGADVYTVQVAQGMLLQALGGMVVDVVVDGEEGLGCVGDGAHETAIGDGSDEAAAAIEHGRVCAEDGVLVQHDIPFDAAAEHIPYTTAPHTSHTTAHTPHTTHTPAAQQGSVLDAHPLPPPAPVQSHRTFPDYGHEKPPIHASVQKDRVLLQASGEAQYVADIPLPAGALYAAFVLSTQAATRFTVDTTAACALPGVVRYLDAQDIPHHGGNFAAIPPDARIPMEPLFAVDRVEYVGQPVGLVLATSQAVAERAACLICISYTRDGAHEPVVVLQEAVDKGMLFDEALYDRATIHRGNVPTALATAPHTIKHAQWHLPSQYHFYMEPQTAVALPQEGGRLTVHAGVQSVDMVQELVSKVVGLPMTDVVVTCRRMGGGFGGKANRSQPTAAAAALAAHLTQCPVRLVNTRNADMAMVGGRCEMLFTYNVGFDGQGRILALDVVAYFQGGAFLDMAYQDMQIFADGIEQVYHIPNLRFEPYMVRTNVPPRTNMRAPGFFQASLVIEHIIEHVARQLNMCADELRVRNFLKHEAPPLAVGAPFPQYNCTNTSSTSTTSTTSECYNDASWEVVKHECKTLDEEIDEKTTTAASCDHTAACAFGNYRPAGALCTNKSTQQGGPTSAPRHMLRAASRWLTSLCGTDDTTAQTPAAHHSTPPAHHSTHSACRGTTPPTVDHPTVDQPSIEAQPSVSRGLNQPTSTPPQPVLYRIWSELQTTSQYSQRAAAVAQFNATHAWQKKGIAMTACRYHMVPLAQPAAVSVYRDGSVVVACAGTEMGQGLTTKVKQVCLFELSRLFGGSGNGEGGEGVVVPWECVRVADNNTELLPNGPCTGGSTTSEGSCQAVRMACKQIVQQLQPFVAEGAKNWADVCLAAMPGRGMPSNALMSAYAYYDGTCTDGSGTQLDYHSYGACVSEVTIDILTGNRCVERVDLLFDCGKPLNPAIDIGQCEGAFIQGMGLVLQEHIAFDPTTAANISTSTWEYKIPTAACIPRVFNVSLLKDSTHPGGVLSSKAMGEPPLLLSASVMCAIRRAVEAARAGLGDRQGDAVEWTVPLGPREIVAAIGGVDVAKAVIQSGQWA